MGEGNCVEEDRLLPAVCTYLQSQVVFLQERSDTNVI